MAPKDNDEGNWVRNKDKLAAKTADICGGLHTVFSSIPISVFISMGVARPYSICPNREEPEVA